MPHKEQAKTYALTCTNVECGATTSDTKPTAPCWSCGSDMKVGEFFFIEGGSLEVLIASERATLLARLQAEVIDPAIDGDFGTVDVKVIGERLLGWVEAQLTATGGDKPKA